MPKPRLSWKTIVTHWFTYHPWLKIIALVLAILTWFYVRDEINRFNAF